MARLPARLLRAHRSRRSSPLLLLLVVSASASASSTVRLDRLLSSRGLGSRRDVSALVRAGRVASASGAPLGRADARVDASATLLVDGVACAPVPLLVAYHKPVGVHSTMRDERGRADLSSALPPAWRAAMHPVGRLDADTSGLLLFSRDGALTQRLLHPRRAVEREYVARVSGAVEASALGERLREGVECVEAGERVVFCGVLLGVEAGGKGEGDDAGGGSTVRVVVTEGKHREVRRMLHNAGHSVIALHRVRYGGVVLEEGLGEGEAVAVDAEWAMGGAGGVEWGKGGAVDAGWQKGGGS